MSRLHSIWFFLRRFLEIAGMAQVRLTSPSWMEGLAGQIYILWFATLALVPMFLGQFFEISDVVVLVWAAVIGYLALGLTLTHFLYDGEKEAGRRGLLAGGRGKYIQVNYHGNVNDPTLELQSPYEKRLGFLTLLAGGLGLVLSFGLSAQAIHSIQLNLEVDDSELWFDLQGYPRGFWDWAYFSVLNVFRALDLFDTMPTFNRTVVADTLLEKSVGVWWRRLTQPIHHNGMLMSSIVFCFKAVFDLLLLAKLRGVLFGELAFRKAVKATEELPQENRDQILRNLSGSLLELGAGFTSRYFKRFVETKGYPLEVRAFAAQVVAKTGVDARQLGGEMVSLLEVARVRELPAITSALMESIGRLEVSASDIPRDIGGSATGIEYDQLGLNLWSGNSLSMEFVPVAPGNFRMGSPAGEFGRLDEREALREVSLTRGFWLAKYPVTQGAFKKLTGWNPSGFTMNVLQARGSDSSKLEQHPVENISWHQANAFCLWLTLVEQKAGNIPMDWEFRLPTEAEWEYACRAGAVTALYSGKEVTGLDCPNVKEIAWFDRNSELQTWPVGEKPGNPWGLHDMLGNIFEWCQDWAEEKLDAGPSIDPGGPKSGSSRVVRGGNWYYNSARCRAAYRAWDYPGYRYELIGFRLALSPGRSEIELA